MDRNDVLIDLDTIFIPQKPTVVNNEYVKNINLVPPVIVSPDENVHVNIFRLACASENVHSHSHIQTTVSETSQEIRELEAEYYDKLPVLINLFNWTDNNSDYLGNIKHELKECFSILLDRCRLPCCFFGIATCFIGCFNMISVVCNCNRICCLNLCKTLTVITLHGLLWTLLALFIVYGTKSSIYYHRFNSSTWIIIEATSHIFFTLFLTWINMHILNVKKNINSLRNYSNPYCTNAYIYYTYIEKQIRVLNYTTHIKLIALFCKIIWTFLGLMFLINNEQGDTTYILIFFDVGIASIIQVATLFCTLNLHNIFILPFSPFNFNFNFLT